MQFQLHSLDLREKRRGGRLKSQSELATATHSCESFIPDSFLPESRLIHKEIEWLGC